MNEPIWVTLTLPDGQTYTCQMRQLVSDQRLRRIPDVDTRNEIKKAAVEAACQSNPSYRAITDLRARCSDSIKQRSLVRRANMFDEAMAIDDEIKRWTGIEQLCILHLVQFRARTKLSDETLAGLLERWLVLRFATMQASAGRHVIGAKLVIEDGIIKRRDVA